MNYLFIIILIIFLGLSGGAVYFLRQNKAILKEGEDFEILE